jgi:hypothetical protein
MFVVVLGKSRHIEERISTVASTNEYLLDLAKFIVRTVPDAEVHAHLGGMAGDEAVFRGSDAAVEDDVEMF